MSQKIPQITNYFVTQECVNAWFVAVNGVQFTPALINRVTIPQDLVYVLKEVVLLPSVQGVAPAVMSQLQHIMNELYVTVGGNPIVGSNFTGAIIGECWGIEARSIPVNQLILPGVPVDFNVINFCGVDTILRLTIRLMKFNRAVLEHFKPADIVEWCIHH